MNSLNVFLFFAACFTHKCLCVTVFFLLRVVWAKFRSKRYNNIDIVHTHLCWLFCHLFLPSNTHAFDVSWNLFAYCQPRISTSNTVYYASAGNVTRAYWTKYNGTKKRTIEKKIVKITWNVHPMINIQVEWNSTQTHANLHENLSKLAKHLPIHIN